MRQELGPLSKSFSTKVNLINYCNFLDNLRGLLLVCPGGQSNPSGWEV